MTATLPPPADPIPVAQNRDELLLLARAWTHRYGVAQRWRRARLAGTVVLSLAGPLVVLAASGAGAGLGAFAGLWTVLARTALGDLEQRSRRRGAALQEAFDTALFGVPWNAALAGPAPAPEDIDDDARDVDDADLRDWYPGAVGRVRWPLDALLCQRSSVVWGRRTHTAYATLLLCVTVAWWLVGMLIGVLAGLDLGAYLIGLFLPSLPAFLDAAELWRTHREQAASKQSVERDADALLADARADARLPDLARLRELQDRILLTRRSGPQVPRRFYRWRRARDEAAMQGAAESLVADLPTALTRAGA